MLGVTANFCGGQLHPHYSGTRDWNISTQLHLPKAVFCSLVSSHLTWTISLNSDLNTVLQLYVSIVVRVSRRSHLLVALADVLKILSMTSDTAGSYSLSSDFQNFSVSIIKMGSHKLLLGHESMAAECRSGQASSLPARDHPPTPVG